MKGLSGKNLDESVEYFLETMQLTDFIKRKAGRLSGGNKRKLCVTNALIGGKIYFEKYFTIFYKGPDI